jgi:isopentenyl-diphosphate delta-isomerase
MDRSMVILVDEEDKPRGTAEKMEAHLKGELHRAFSIFIFNGEGDLLLQRRAMDKYHSGGLWTNTCCSHPIPDMSLEGFARLRLQEEMGFDTPLYKVFDFIYRADMENGLVEHEFDHVLVGNYSGPVFPDPSEVMEYKFLSPTQIEDSLDEFPHMYTAWFRMAFPRVNKWQQRHNGEQEE